MISRRTATRHVWGRDVEYSDTTTGDDRVTCLDYRRTIRFAEGTKSAVLLVTSDALFADRTWQQLTSEDTIE